MQPLRNEAVNSNLEKYPFRIGLFGIGLDTYWSQFPGLEKRLKSILSHSRFHLRYKAGAEVVNLGLIDTPEKGSRDGT
jgi:L-arabinose isomerase